MVWSIIILYLFSAKANKMHPGLAWVKKLHLNNVQNMIFTHSRPECILFTISDKPYSSSISLLKQLVIIITVSKFLVCHQKYVRKCPQNNNSDIVNPSRTRVGAELPFCFSFHDACEKYKWISFNEHSSAKAVCARCTELSSFA